MDFSVKGLLLTVGPAVMKTLIAIGLVSLAWAVVNERRMQKHRRSGVSYREATLRRDGGWKRSDLFTDAGLAYQGQAAKWGFLGTVSLLVAFLLAWLLGSI